MRFRTLALALALALVTGAVSKVHAADQTVKRGKQLNKQRAKQSKAAKIKPRKARKVKKVAHR
jgi:hypothetical protein